jgi:hypothetical protein
MGEVRLGGEIFLGIRNSPKPSNASLLERFACWGLTYLSSPVIDAFPSFAKSPRRRSRSSRFLESFSKYSKASFVVFFRLECFSSNFLWSKSISAIFSSSTDKTVSFSSSADTPSTEVASPERYHRWFTLPS